MLSNPTKTLHNRQRQHRRQNSTPTAFEPVKTNNLPNIHQKHGAHRRGMSLDQRRRPTPPQDVTHILRETQQQRLVRPGQHFSLDNDENYLSSPAITPQRQSFDTGYINYGERVQPQPQYNCSGPIEGLTYVDPNNFTGANDFHLFGADGQLTPSAYLDFSTAFDSVASMSNGNTESRRSSAGRRISGGILDRVAQFENMAMQSSQRPITPPNQNVSNYFPPTPMDTPHNRMVKQEQMNQRFMDSYDTSMEETIKPKTSQRARGVFEDMRREAEMHSGPSPPHDGLMSMASNFDSAPMPTGNFMNMSNLDMEFLKNESQFQDQQYSPVIADPSPALSYNSSPEITQRTIRGDPFRNAPSLGAPAMSYAEAPAAHNQSIPESPSSRSSHRRSESVDSINIDETITDTGITIDDIATYIQGPDLLDGKWMCLYPDCCKRFGRKENIKSHVQTHLGDRQFQCPHCQKCFVRQHDLKRHAKIHSGVKPYPCQCGNSFARHDALTRHRQRGMCIGAFDGVVKKTVKRGRPRKARPDDEDRLQKSSRTRSKNKAMSSASSSSGSSDSTSGHSPRSEIDILDDKLFGNFQYPQVASSSHPGQTDYQGHSPTAEIGISPSAMQNAASPEAYSSRSNYSRNNSVSDHQPSLPGSPAHSQHSQYHSPPGLCESSSSPAPSHYYDMENISNHGDVLHSLSLANISEHEDEMFLEAFASAGSTDMSQLERDPDLLLSKFDDDFVNSNGGDLFRDEADVFFGSP
ncbi:C2H2 and C2HC zinc finger [Glarea lozoyensis ATCC 20868]|uniref:C2H2 and C2HC zinc finger n=1 Tax=Glarea lozoyensis (strain ATCC 20868 / MF5171) TaxID=1116229 RepID=S3DDT7_GLAL2|nr:C2H2 and C2HC zinc finger [Glarea lozoyensis ATCC 20868]EPE35910.1 C2H2 and C2HC zinc finger [Glarea lozoyensis ATCC 20868]